VPATVAALLLAGCASPWGEAGTDADAACTPVPAAELVPVDGAWLGTQLDPDVDPLATYSSTLGQRPAVVGIAVEVPMRPADRSRVNAVVDELVDARGILLLTLEPYGGLAAVTDDVAAELAIRLDGYNRRGVPVVVRFAPEMNGHWYDWGQQPTAYVAAFRRIAAAVHAEAPGSATLWAPAYGGGYPFMADLVDESDAAVLDVDRDGRVTRTDDPYAPYWPGADAVDWVGLSLFHWGDTWPWGENEVPEPGKLLAQLTGTYTGLGGDDRALPDFYATYGEGHDKPVAIPETGALWAPDAGGAPERAIKQAWWRQVFDDELLTRLPRLAMVTWVERELPPDGDLPAVDWRALARPELADAYRAELPAWARWAESVPRCVELNASGGAPPG
jgi:hypothetical protein